MWRDLEKVVTADSGPRRRSTIAFEPDWMADAAARSSKPSTNGKHRREPDVVGFPLVNPPSSAFIIVDTLSILPFYPEPLPISEPVPVIASPAKSGSDYTAEEQERRPRSSANRNALSASGLMLTALGLTSFLCGGLAVALYDRSVTGPATLVASELADQMTRIERRIANLPMPSAAPDLQPLRDELKEMRAALDVMKQEKREQLRAALDEMKKEEVVELRSVVEEIKRESLAIQTLRGRVEELKVDLDVSRASLEAKLKTLKDNAAQYEHADAAGQSYATPQIIKRGTDLFQQGDCAKARDLFRVAKEIYPNDARLWYFAALTEMRFTGQWPGAGEQLFRKGIECEQAGSPPASEIESAFASVRQRDGRDWLAYYRSLARPLPTLSSGP